MYFEKWDDIAFGSDPAMDLVDFLEDFDNETITMKEIFSKSDFETKLVDVNRNDHFTIIHNGFDQEILFDQALITMGAIIVETELNNSADMSKVFTGSKTLKLVCTEENKNLLINNLSDMIQNPEDHELMELSEDYIDEVIAVIQDIINHLKN